MASGNTLLTLSPLGATFPASNYPVLDFRNNHPVLKYDDTTDETAYYDNLILPRHYAGGGITLYLHVALTSATANAIKFEAAFERIGDGQQDLDADGFATANNSGDVTVPATSGHIKIFTIVFTNSEIDGLTAGEGFRLKITSKVPTGTKATGDREFFAAELKET